MSPCSPSDVSFNVPSGPSGPAIPGFGIPFSLDLPNLNPFPDGFPEDLLALLNELEMLIPPGALKPQLNLNFGKDVFDAIMKLLDQFMPFLMLYKFFLPILNLIICIIEVLCALMNPFKLISAINRLFRQCIPEFLNLFPIFALIIMIISLLLLILALIEYIINQILALIKALLRNINALVLAFQNSDATGVIAIALKIGAMLCIFQNLFVLFAVFNIIIGIIKDILSKLFSIPPCEDSNSDGCCTTDVCPAIVKNTYTNTTGTLKYFPQIGLQFSNLFPTLGANIRNEMWQLFDTSQTQPEAFSNIYNAFDVTINPKPIFFPTDATYSQATDPSQAPYQIDLRLFYNPSNWGRSGAARFIQFKNCIMLQVPSPNLILSDNSPSPVATGVSTLVGGLGFEDDGTTILTGFAPDGVTPISGQATLENFIHTPAIISATPPTPNINDGYTFSEMQYTFRPNIPPLLQKNIVTLGCVPDIAINREFINNVFAGNAGIQAALLGNLSFPDPGAAQQCMTTALSALRSNLTVKGVAEFQATTTVCLNKLQSDTKNTLGSVIGIGFDPCSSSFTANPPVQFTTQPVVVSVNINERNGLPLTNNLPPDVAANVAAGLKGHLTFGNISNFTYDGYQLFQAFITSPTPGTGQVMISYNNQTLCTNTIPADPTIPPTHTLQTKDYQFIYTPVGGSIPIIGTGEGDTQGVPRRDGGDQARDGTGNDGGT